MVPRPDVGQRPRRHEPQLSPAAANITEDAWFGERLGHPVFSVVFEPGGEPAPGEIEAHAAERGTVLYQAKVPADRPGTVAALGRAGFAVVNVGVTLAREPGDLGVSPAPGVEVREADPGADRAILEIAERSFTKTRFHLDPAIPDAVANRIKRDWAENSLTGGRGDGMLVAVRDEAPVGFIASLSTDTGQGRVRVIDLIAVAEEARRSGAGRALVSAFVVGAQASHDLVLVGTQAANPLATSFYERLGFTTISSEYDLHLHAGGAA